MEISNCNFSDVQGAELKVNNKLTTIPFEQDHDISVIWTQHMILVNLHYMDIEILWDTNVSRIISAILQ